MPDRAVISEESFFFITVETLCKGPAVTCGADLSVVEAARLMQQRNISCLVIAEDEIPRGIVSVRDLRDLIADSGGAVAGRRVGEIMKTDLVSIRPKDYLFEAIFRMAKHNIHRLAVIDDAGRLLGVITDTDLLRIKTRTPLYLNQELEAAQSVEQLRAINARLIEMVRFATRAGADTKSLVQLISHFNDAFTLRLIALMEEQEGIRLPAGAAYLILGSEGRGEQTLRTDQDSAIVLADDFPAEDLPEVARFSERLVDGLARIGVPRCPGDTMASNPEWRRTLSGWEWLLHQWITVPKSEHMVNFGMFQDLRALHGDETLARALRDHILASIGRNNLFLPYMARHIVRFPPPLGMFGRIKVERRGEHRGKVDLKKAGVFALTRGVSLLALEAGIIGGSTWEKAAQLGARGVLSTSDLEVIDEAFTTLVRLRLLRQLRDLAAGHKPSNHVDPLILTDRERDSLRHALKGVGVLLRILRDRYKLDFISR